MTEHLRERIGVEVPGTGHALLESLHAGRDGFLIVGNLGGKADGVLRVDRILEAQVQGHGLVQPEGGVVEGVAERRILLVLLDVPGAFLDLLEPRLAELVPRVMLAVFAGGRVGLGQLEQRLELRVIHAEDLPAVGNLGAGHERHQPFGGGNDLGALVPGFGRLEIGRLLFADAGQRVARQRIKGLQTAIEDHGQATHGAEGILAVTPGHERTQDPKCEERRDDQGKTLFHGSGGARWEKSDFSRGSFRRPGACGGR